MSLDKDWESIRPDRGFRAADAGMGVLRITLLFGSAAVALALIAAPFLDSHTRPARSRHLYAAPQRAAAPAQLDLRDPQRRHAQRRLLTWLTIFPEPTYFTAC